MDRVGLERTTIYRKLGRQGIREIEDVSDRARALRGAAHEPFGKDRA
jgi:hypothetical protein